MGVVLLSRVGGKCEIGQLLTVAKARLVREPRNFVIRVRLAWFG